MLGLRQHLYRRTNVRVSPFFLGALKRRMSSASYQLLDQNANLNIGENYSGFTLQEIIPSKEFNMNVIRFPLLDFSEFDQFKHEASGADYIHFERKDSDNAFCIGLRTPPSDNTGVPHILEHTTLCGSAKYPVRDPFFKLLRRSLKTFMNAMTASDHTMYPFSTQNKQDFYNLMGVYGDCVFFPNLEHNDFLQEGHRLEFETLNDSSTPLTIKGVVFNEMKGAMSDSGSLWYQQMYEALLPDTIYAFNSGGDPESIPDLTHQQLRAFHARHYHPSNAAFLSYGDLPVRPHLDFVQKHILQNEKFSVSQQPTAASEPPTITSQPRWTEPRRVETVCAEDPLLEPGKQNKVGIAFALDYTSQPSDGLEYHLETLSLQFLGSLMADSLSSPMYQALIASNLASGFTPGTGFDAAGKDPVMSFGAMGVADSNEEEVLSVLQATLEKVAQEGFPEERIQAQLHQWELSIKQVSANFGVDLLCNVTNLWVHDRTLGFLYVSKLIDLLKQRLEQNPKYFGDLIRQHLLSNTHKLTMIQRSSATYTAEQQAKESERVQAVEQNLSEQDRQKLVVQAEELRDQQMKEEDISCLPTLTVQDISPTVEPTGISRVEQAAYPLWVNEQPTNGLGYFRAAVSIEHIPQHLRPYIPLLSSFFGALNTEHRSYTELSEQMDLHTGILSANESLTCELDNLDSHKEMLVLQGGALTRNIPQMLQLLEEVATSTQWQDPNRLRTLLLEKATAISQALMDSGLSYANMCASAGLTSIGQAQEEWAGLTAVRFIDSICPKGGEGDDAMLQTVGANLQELAELVLRKGLRNMDRYYLIGDSPALSSLRDQVEELGPRATVESGNAGQNDRPIFSVTPGQKTFLPLPIQVNNVAMSLRTVHTLHPDSPALTVLARVLSTWIHEEVREKGGAYGGGAASTSGVFNFYSYRDPNSLETLDIFCKVVQSFLDNPSKCSETTIQESLLSVFSEVDAPISPRQKGVQAFFGGVTDELRQQYRDAILATTREDLVRVTREYVHPDRMRALLSSDESFNEDGAVEGAIAVVGAQETLPKAVQDDSSWTVANILEEPAEEACA